MLKYLDTKINGKYLRKKILMFYQKNIGKIKLNKYARFKLLIKVAESWNKSWISKAEHSFYF